MKNIMFSALSILLLVSCGKDQKAVQKMDGTWNASKWEVSDGGLTIDLVAAGGSAELTFENCELKDDTYCGYKAYTQLLGVYDTLISTYRVRDGGTILEVRDENGTVVNTTQILELTNDFMRLKEVNESQTLLIEANKE